MSRLTRLARALISSKWVKPSLKEEWEEILRTAKQFDLDPKILKEAYKKGHMISLSDSIWSRLKNTDSWEEIEPGDWDAVQQLAIKYNKESRKLDTANFGKGRSPSRIREGLEEGLPMPAPMVLSTHGIYYLIGGNTRLMVSRAIGVRPEILLLTVGNGKRLRNDTH
jgi:hypothetical protein